ncbi:MAG: hypothetical protein WCK86_04170 [Planctomycetia bacterium]
MAMLHIENFPELEFSATRPIGRVPGRRDATLTLTGPSAERAGELVFQKEIAATWGTVERNVPYPLLKSSQIVTGMARWWRLEVQVESDEAFIEAGMELVMARLPAACWAVSAPFKKSVKHGAAGSSNPLAIPCNGIEEAIERLEDLDYDYWEKGKYLTAGVSAPPDPMSDQRRNFSRGDWLLGVCHNVKASCEILISSEQAEKLLAWTKNGQLKHWPPHEVIPDRYKTLHADVKDDAEWLMYLSIRQSLAGPWDGDANWMGRPVMDLVEIIYKNHVYNRNRGLVDKDQRLGDLFRRGRAWQDQQNRRQGRHPRPGNSGNTGT